MERNLKVVEGAFCSKGFTFVCEGRYHDVDLPGSTGRERIAVQNVFLSSGALPDLSGAPVASWLLARIAYLAAKRFPYSYGQVIGSDAAAYWVRYFVVSEAGLPVAMLSVSANTRDICLDLTHTDKVTPKEICDAFVLAILEKPASIARCRLITVYTELTDPDCRFAVPRVYGWNGKRFLNETAPEHALEIPGDFD